MTQLPPRRVSSSPAGKNTHKKAAKSGPSSTAIPLLIVIGVLAVGAGAAYIRNSRRADAPVPLPVAGGGELPGQQDPAPATASQTPAKPWPPKEGAAREAVFGTTDGEPVLPAMDETILTSPLRPRSIDPWFRIANPRWAPRPSGWLTMELDIEIIAPPPEGQKSHFVITNPEKPSESRNVGADAISRFLATGQRTGKIDLVIHMGHPSNQPKLDDCEVYAVASDDNYCRRLIYRTATGTRTLAGSPLFKVSNTVTVGSVPNPTRSRDWTDDEYAHYTGPAEHDRDHPAEFEYLTQPALAKAAAAVQPIEGKRDDAHAAPEKPDRPKENWKLLDAGDVPFTIYVPPTTRPQPAQSGTRFGRRYNLKQYTGQDGLLVMIVEWITFPDGPPDNLSDVVLKSKLPVLYREMMGAELPDDLFMYRDEVRDFQGHSGRTLSFRKGNPPKVLNGESTYILLPDGLVTIRFAHTGSQQRIIDLVYEMMTFAVQPNGEAVPQAKPE